MKGILKVLVLAAVVMAVTGCGSYHTALRPTDSGFHDIVKDSSNMKVYVEPADLEDCLWAPLRQAAGKCVKINTSSVLVPALKKEGIKVVGNQKDANVIVRLNNLKNGRGWDHATITAEFGINSNSIKIIARPYMEGSLAYVADKRDWDAGVKTIEMVITKLLKYNKICNDCTIEAKTAYSKEDGSKILEYSDNIRF